MAVLLKRHIPTMVSELFDAHADRDAMISAEGSSMASAPRQPTVSLDHAGAMPLVGLGTGALTGRQCYQAVRYALEVGYRHLDTATMYFNEPEVGRAVRDSEVPRQEVFVTTKLPPEAAGRERQTLADSLRALGMEYVDLWLVHWPPPGRALVSTWTELLAIRDQGLARAVGVSNHSPAQLDELIQATGRAPQVNQIPWAPALYDGAQLAEHRQRGVVLEGYSPFTSTDLGDPVLAEVAAAHGVSPAQVVLRWHLEHGVVVIPRSGTRERIAANLDVFGFALTEEQRGRIDRLSTGRRR